MHAHAKKRVSAAERAICPQEKGCSHCHDVASEAIAAGDSAFVGIIDEYERLIHECPACKLRPARCERCRGRRDVIDALRPFLVPA